MTVKRAINSIHTHKLDVVWSVTCTHGNYSHQWIGL